MSGTSTSGSVPRILIVEDEADIRDLIELHLKRERYAVESVSEGEEGMQKLLQDRYQLVILDWMLPGMSGLEIAKALRQNDATQKLPILMVTARMEPADIVLGLESGADDYVTKPFEIPVLLARVRALLRRSAEVPPAKSEAGRIQVGALSLDPSSYQVTCAGEPVTLTLSEFKLLMALVQNKGRVLTRDRLIDLVQGEGVSVVDRAIDTHVFGLRKKLGNCADSIETVRGVGYRVKLD